ncbi:hypothetical protein EXS72_00895 [Candidatus Pacearchaeota archaeon]|nr:hypothetical protein [Candidatus Pacearchaeota archaeon]
MVEVLSFHIGKQGLTKDFIDHVAIAFKTRKVIKIQLLKSASDDRSEIKRVAEEIIVGLPGKYNYRVIGFTIILMKRTLMRKEPSKKRFIGKHSRNRTNS